MSEPLQECIATIEVPLDLIGSKEEAFKVGAMAVERALIDASVEEDMILFGATLKKHETISNFVGQNVQKAYLTGVKSEGVALIFGVKHTVEVYKEGEILVVKWTMKVI